MWSHSKKFSRTLITGFPISRRRAKSCFWGRQPPLSGNRQRGGVWEWRFVWRGFFPSVDIFLALVTVLSDWLRVGGEELSSCGCLGLWRPSDTGIMEISGFQGLED